MFGFSMMFNYEDRKVDRYEDGVMVISMAAVDDSDKPYETAVAHPNYNDGKFVIVSTYDSRLEAEIGHQAWVQIMTAETLPVTLNDVSTAFVTALMDAIGGTDWRAKSETVEGD